MYKFFLKSGFDDYWFSKINRVDYYLGDKITKNETYRRDHQFYKYLLFSCNLDALKLTISAWNFNFESELAQVFIVCIRYKWKDWIWQKIVMKVI